eukprot:5766445-Amphidinium_carterae.2
MASPRIAQVLSRGIHALLVLSCYTLHVTSAFSNCLMFNHSATWEQFPLWSHFVLSFLSLISAQA